MAAAAGVLSDKWNCVTIEGISCHREEISFPGQTAVRRNGQNEPDGFQITKDMQKITVEGPIVNSTSGVSTIFGTYII